jgi:hypothetical protein
MRQPDNDQLETKQLNGRIVSLSTYWWAKQPQAEVVNLFCIHGVNLKKDCVDCEYEVNNG